MAALIQSIFVPIVPLSYVDWSSGPRLLAEEQPLPPSFKAAWMRLDSYAVEDSCCPSCPWLSLEETLLDLNLSMSVVADYSSFRLIYQWLETFTWRSSYPEVEMIRHSLWSISSLASVPSSLHLTWNCLNHLIAIFSIASSKTSRRSAADWTIVYLNSSSTALYRAIMSLSEAIP